MVILGVTILGHYSGGHYLGVTILEVTILGHYSEGHLMGVTSGMSSRISPDVVVGVLVGT